jgi:hypothetical protein
MNVIPIKTSLRDGGTSSSPFTLSSKNENVLNPHTVSKARRRMSMNYGAVEPILYLTPTTTVHHKLSLPYGKHSG